MAKLTQNQNQFSQTPALGMLDRVKNPSVVPVRINPASEAILTAGSAVKLIAGATPEILVDAVTGPTDGPVFGFIIFSTKKASYSAGENCEVAFDGSAIKLKAAAAIARGAEVACVAGTADEDPLVKTAVTADYVAGTALGQAGAAGEVITVLVKPTQVVI